MTNENNTDFNEEFEDKDLENSQNSKIEYERFTEEEYEQFAKLFNGISIKRAKEILDVIKHKQEVDIVKTIILKNSSIADASASLNIRFITISNKLANVKAKIRMALQDEETLTLKSGITIKNSDKPLSWEYIYDSPSFSMTQVSDNTKNYFSFTDQDYEHFFTIYREIEKETLKDALDELNTREKIILWLIDILNYSAKEIAELYKMKHSSMAMLISGARGSINRLGEQATVNNSKSNENPVKKNNTENNITPAEYVKLLLYKQILSREDYFVVYALSVLKKPKYMVEKICDIEAYQITHILSEASRIYNMPTQAYISQTMIAREHYDTYKQIKEKTNGKPIDLTLLAPDYNPDIERILDVRFLESLLLSNKDTLKGERIFYAFYNNRYGKKKLIIEDLAKKLNTSAEAIKSSFSNIQKRLDDYHTSTHYQKTKERLLSLPFEKRYEIFTNLVQPSYNPEVANYYLLKTLKDRLGKEKQIDFNILYISKYSAVPKTLEEIAELFPTLTFEEITQKYNETSELAKEISNSKELRELHDKNAKEKVDFAVFRPIINTEHLELASNAETINHTIFNSLVRELNIEDYWIAWSITFSKGSFKGATTNKDFTEFLANELNIEITEAESISKRITTLIVTKTINQASRKVKMFKKDFMIPKPVFAPAFKKVVLDNYFRSTFDNTTNTVAHHTYIEKNKSNQEIAQLIGATVEEVNAMKVEIKAKVNEFINSSNYINIFEQLSQLPRTDKIAIVNGTIQLEDIITIPAYTPGETSLIKSEFSPITEELIDAGKREDSQKKLRKNPVRRVKDITFFETHPDVAPERIIAIMSSNPNKLQRQILEMHEGVNGHEKMSVYEIAETLGIDSKKVSKAIYAGGKKIETVLNKTANIKQTIFDKYPGVPSEIIVTIISNNISKLQSKVLEMREGLNGNEKMMLTEIAEALNISLEETKSVLYGGYAKVSRILNGTEKKEQKQTIFERYPDKTSEEIINYISNIKNKKQRQVLEMREGLNGYEKTTVNDIAKALDITSVQVNGILGNGYTRIRDYFRKIEILSTTVSWDNIYISPNFSINPHSGMQTFSFTEEDYKIFADIYNDIPESAISEQIDMLDDEQKVMLWLYAIKKYKPQIIATLYNQTGKEISGRIKQIKQKIIAPKQAKSKKLTIFEKYPDRNPKEIIAIINCNANKEQRQTLEMFEGLNGYEKTTMQEIATKLGITRNKAYMFLLRGYARFEIDLRENKHLENVSLWEEVYRNPNFSINPDSGVQIFSFTEEDYKVFFTKYKGIPESKILSELDSLENTDKIMLWLNIVKEYKSKVIAQLFNQKVKQVNDNINRIKHKIGAVKIKKLTIYEKYSNKTKEEVTAAIKGIKTDIGLTIFEMFEGLNNHEKITAINIAKQLDIDIKEVRKSIRNSYYTIDCSLNPKKKRKRERAQNKPKKITKEPEKVLTWNEIHAHPNFNFNTTPHSYLLQKTMQCYLTCIKQYHQLNFKQH